MATKLAPIHPGEILKLEFLEPLRLSQYRLAKSIGVALPRVNAIVAGKRSISADTALRLGRFFDTSPEFWTTLQARYDLERRRDELGRKLELKVAVFRAEKRGRKR